MRVLISYGSKMGGTHGLAMMIADAFARRGVSADVRPAGSAVDIDGYDAVVVGAGLYANRWVRSERRFLSRHRVALRAKPVWFFSSGPLDGSAEESDIGPTAQVQKLMASVGARGHATFGGFLPEDAKGFPAAAMAKEHAGDWRSQEHVDAWVASIVEELATSATG